MYRSFAFNSPRVSLFKDCQWILGHSNTGRVGTNIYPVRLGSSSPQNAGAPPLADAPGVPWFSQRSPRGSGITIAWKPVRKASSWTPSQPTEVETFGVKPSIFVLTSLPDDSDAKVWKPLAQRLRHEFGIWLIQLLALPLSSCVTIHNNLLILGFSSVQWAR